MKHKKRHLSGERVNHKRISRKTSALLFFRVCIVIAIYLSLSRHVLCLSKHIEIQKSLVLYLILEVYVQINKSPLLHCVGVIFG